MHFYQKLYTNRKNATLREKMKKILITTIVLLCALFELHAQYDVHYTHYWKMQNFYNPAGAGATKKMHIFAGYSNQMSGFENNPKSMLFNLDAPLTMLKGDHSIGLGILNDEAGMFTNQHLFLNYAYALKIFSGRLAIGAQVGLLNEKFDPSGIILGQDKNDPAFPTKTENGNKVDFGAGILFQHKYFCSGISALHINAPLIYLGEKNQMQIDPFYNFMAEGNIPLKNTLITIQPSMMLMTDLVSYRADITAKGNYKYNNRNIFGGVTYSPATSVALFLGMELTNVTLSYGYEIFTSGVGAAHGNHDIYIGYDFNFDIFKKGKNKHNSIRVLQ